MLKNIPNFARLTTAYYKINIARVVTNKLTRFDVEHSQATISTSAMKSVKIYTKTGDKGTSATFAGDRRPKTDDIFEALGVTDELTCALGVARQYTTSEKFKELDDQLFKIQCILQDLASNVATPKKHARAAHLRQTRFDGKRVALLEKWIDEHSAKLPELKNFIIPGGSIASAHLQLARAICRRAERRVVPLVISLELDDKALMFLNRLSDYLFTIARVASILEGVAEQIYIKAE